MSQPETSAEKPPSPRLDFAKAAREILHDHPKMAGHILFVDPATHETHGTLRARARALLSRPLRQKLKAAFKAASDNAGAIADVITLKSVSAVLLTTGRETPEEALFDLHRQAAKLVVPAGRPLDKYFRDIFDIPYAHHEAIADTYAAIRLLRAPEADADFLRRLSLKRAADFIRTGAPENLTSFALDAIIAGGNYSKLKTEDIAGTVEQCADAYTPTRAQSGALMKTFAPLKGRTLDETALKELADITRATNDPMAAKLGGKILAAAGIDMHPQTKPAALKPAA